MGTYPNQSASGCLEQSLLGTAHLVTIVLFNLQVLTSVETFLGCTHDVRLVSFVQAKWEAHIARLL